MTVEELYIFFLSLWLGNWVKLKDAIAGFLSKIQTVYISTVSFGQIKPEKIVFGFFGWKRTIFRPEKWSFNKSTNNGSFFQGISPSFLPTIWTFYQFFWGANQATKGRFWIVWIESTRFRSEKWIFKKDQKSKFFQGVGPRFLSKIRTFNHLCVLGKSSHKRSFLDSLDI